MELPRLRLHLASIATTAIQNNFDADNHSAEQTYMEDFGSLDTYMPSLYKMRIYRNCFEPCMSFDTYFEDFHIQYSDDVDGIFVQSSFYLNRNSLGGLDLPEKNFKVQRLKARKSRKPVKVESKIETEEAEES